MARPSNYDERKVQRVLDLVADGASYREACRRVRIKRGTFSSWVGRDYNGLKARFFSALQAKYLGELDDTVELADSVLGSTNTATVFAAKNAADARRFIAGRILREFHPEAHLQIDHRKVEVHLYLPGKPGMVDRPHLIEGQAVEMIEDQTDD